MTKVRFNSQVKQQVDRLLSEMTLAQKVGQMTQAERSTCTPDDVYAFHLGSVLSGAGSCPKNNLVDDWVEMCDAYWHASVRKDDAHLGIPIMYGVDAVHGNSNVKDAVIFPHNIGLGATNDFSLIKDIAAATAKEVLAIGVDWVFSPNLAVASDYRWGRTYESFSQDPKQVSKFAQAMVEGLQDNFSDNGVLACVKHWIGDGGTQNGIDQGDTVLDWEQLNNIHIYPYYAALDAGAMSVMVSFSSWNGEKCHAHKYLISDVLKGQMRYQGLVLSDMQGIDYLADDFYQAVARGVNAGIDMFMLPGNWKQFIDHLINHVELGTVPISRIDDAVRRILSVKVATGIMDKPAPSARPYTRSKMFGARKHRQLACSSVQKSLVLLKNEHELLPLSKQQKIVVTGKNAHCIGSQCGGFTVTWQGSRGNHDVNGATSIWQGIDQLADNAQLIGESDLLAVKQGEFDVAVVVIGELPYAEGLGDIRDNEDAIVASGLQIQGQMSITDVTAKSLALQNMHPEDLSTISTLHDKGIPVVTVLISGRPLLIEAEMERSQAFIAAWLPGSEGQGIANVLFGDAPVTGKLSFSWPHTPSPDVDPLKPKRKSKSDTVSSSKFPVGYGLRYKKRGFFKSAS
ncbi:glycoside hydrolase family 3 protein [Aliiglaciecola litoralis]|uniref:Beta-glucosidase n=1 Tax=Aliiglaciecola litoralis TaxID=582857 RepID=A0ABP3X2L0_9ALTE